MKIINPVNNGTAIILKGFSTLDLKAAKIVLLFVVLIAFVSPTYAARGHSTLDRVDPRFNPQVQSGAYAEKWVYQIQVLADGKILALGNFNTYNGAPVGKLVRLNPDGSLDTTFNNQTVTASSFSDPGSRILVQPDGKIVLKSVGLVAGGQGPKQLLRLNTDGTFDSTFNFTQTSFINSIAMDSLGRLSLAGGFTTPQGSRLIIRLNNDGSLDSSFDFTIPGGHSVNKIVAQADRLIVITEGSSMRQIYRLNDDGSADASFTPFTSPSLALGEVQPGNKILYSVDSTTLRLNENGGNDNTFQPILSFGVNGLVLKFTGDGKIVFTTTSSPATIRRYLSNGAVDPSFNQYTTTAFGSFGIQSDDSIVMGDSDLFATGANNFVRLTPGGVPDPTFNVGGTGFKTLMPGIIEAIETYSDGKILLGGRFDLINNITRYRLARLNADSTVDNTFQVNNSGTGNYFSIIKDIYQIRLQPDGKMVVSGFFDYFLGGVMKKNLVRLNSDGSIDSTFNLTHPIPDYSQILLGGQNRFAMYSDGKLMVASSKSGTLEVPGPIKLTAAGARDLTFNPTLNGGSTSLYYDDVAILPDGKILVSGSYATSSGAFKKCYRPPGHRRKFGSNLPLRRRTEPAEIKICSASERQNSYHQK